MVCALSCEDKVVLDGFEGLGEDYFEKLVRVRTRDGVFVEATAYVANPRWLDEAMRPYHWYKGFVTAGAWQHGFPREYCETLEAVDAKDDRTQRIIAGSRMNRHFHAGCA